MNQRLVLFVVAFATIFSVGSAFESAHIDHRADERLAGGTVIGFNDLPLGDYTLLEVSGLTIQGSFNLSSDYAGSYNTTGAASLQNRSGDGGLFTFTFAQPVNAFGFNWGAADTTWVLTAFDAGGNELAWRTLPPTFESNAGEFFGLALDGIAKVTLRADSYDWVFIDNFTFSPGAVIPEPATVAWLMGMVVFGLRLSAFRVLGRNLRSRT